MTSRPRISGTLDPKRVEHVPFPASQKIGSGAGTPRSMTFTRGTAPAIIRSLQSKLIKELPSVLDWSGDDTTQFQSATAEIGASGGGHIIVPPDHLWMLEDTVLTVHPNTHFVGMQGAQVSRVYSDFGPSFQWGNAGALLAGGGVHNLFLRGNTAMTPGVSKSLVAFDHVEDNMCTNLTMQDGCGFFSMAGCNNFVGSNIMASLTGGVPAGRNAIHVFKSTASGPNTYPIGGDIVFDNTNLQLGFDAANCFADKGLLIEAVDGFYWSGHSHILFSNIAHVHVRPDGSNKVYNVEIWDTLLDASQLHAIWLDGSNQTAPAVCIVFNGRASSFGIGNASAVGLLVNNNFWGREVSIHATFEGYQNGAMTLDSDWLETATIVAEAFQCGQSVFAINRGQDITLTPHLRAGGVNGLVAGATVKRLRVKGGSLEGNSGFGAIVSGSAGSAVGGGIDFDNVSMRNNGSGPITIGVGAVASALNCPGLTPIYGSATYNPGTIANGARTFTTVSVPGAKMGDRVIAVTLSVDRLGIEVEAYMAADGSASVLYINDTGAGKTLGSHTLEVAVQRKL